MTVESPTLIPNPVLSAPPATVPQLILATDLDGTFLAGSPQQRHRLYRLIDQHPGITLIFITGRGLEAVMPLLADPAMSSPLIRSRIAASARWRRNAGSFSIVIRPSSICQSWGIASGDSTRLTAGIASWPRARASSATRPIPSRVSRAGSS